MNERIKQLMDQAGIDVEAVENLGEMPTALKFAELIVAECMMLAQSDWVAQSYPSQIDDYAAGINSVRESIKQHFGVEE